MEQGKQGKELLDWLNSLPEVKDSIKSDGNPISRQNLSEWRQGGYREWSLHFNFCRQAARLEEHTDQAEDTVDLPLLAGKMVGLLAIRYAALLNSWDGEPDPQFEKKLLLLRGLNRDIALLQKSLLQAGRHKIEDERQYEEKVARNKKKWQDLALNPIHAALERNNLQSTLEIIYPTAAAKKMAEFVTDVKYGLKTRKKGRSRPSRQTRSNPVKPRQTEESEESEESGETVEPIQTQGASPTDTPEQAEDQPLPEDPQSAPSDSQTVSNPVKPSLPRQSEATAGLSRRSEAKADQTETSDLSVHPGASEGSDPSISVGRDSVEP
jgi:hypothetical protein